MLKIACTGGKPCENVLNKCLASFVSQTFQDWEMVVVLDPGDYDWKVYDPRIKIIYRREYVGSTENFLYAVTWLDPKDEDIVVMMDADDWLYDKYSLAKVYREYDGTDILVTHGKWTTFPFKKRVDDGKTNTAYSRDDFKNMRKACWQGSQLRTFKYKVFKNINEGDFKDEEGRYFAAGCDCAIMYGCMEMAGFDRVKFIKDVIYVYNMSGIRTPHTHGKESRETKALIDSRPPYKEIMF